MFRNLTFMAAALMLIFSTAGCGEKTKAEKETEATPPLPVGVNIIENPSFEEWNGNIPAGWEIQHFEGPKGPGTIANFYGKATDEKKTGSSSFFLRGMFNVERWMVLVQRHPVAPGYRLTFSVETKGKSLTKGKNQFERANMFVRYYDRDGKRLDERHYADLYTSFLLGTSDWHRTSRRAEIPKGAAYAEFGLICQMTGWIYFDDVEAMLDEPVPWKTHESKYVTYYWLDSKPFPPGAIEKEDAFVGECVKKLRLDVKNKVSYYFYPAVDTLREIEGGTTRHELRLYEKQELHTTESYKDHEMIHMLLVPLGHPPFGLAEGAVFYVLGSWNGRDLHMMTKELLLAKRLPPLFRVFRQRPDMEQAGKDVAVPAWCSFCIWLIDHQGIEKFMELYKTTDGVDATDSFNNLFKDVYEKEFNDMDREWRLWVMRYEPRR